MRLLASSLGHVALLFFGVVLFSAGLAAVRDSVQRQDDGTRLVVASNFTAPPRREGDKCLYEYVYGGAARVCRYQVSRACVFVSKLPVCHEYCREPTHRIVYDALLDEARCEVPRIASTPEALHGVLLLGAGLFIVCLACFSFATRVGRAMRMTSAAGDPRAEPLCPTADAA